MAGAKSSRVRQRGKNEPFRDAPPGPDAVLRAHLHGLIPRLYSVENVLLVAGQALLHQNADHDAAIEAVLRVHGSDRLDAAIEETEILLAGLEGRKPPREADPE